MTSSEETRYRLLKNGVVNRFGEMFCEAGFLAAFQIIFHTEPAEGDPDNATLCGALEADQKIGARPVRKTNI
jgi:hypothetical protein